MAATTQIKILITMRAALLVVVWEEHLLYQEYIAGRAMQGDVTAAGSDSMPERAAPSCTRKCLKTASPMQIEILRALASP